MRVVRDAVELGRAARAHARLVQEITARKPGQESV